MPELTSIIPEINELGLFIRNAPEVETSPFLMDESKKGTMWLSPSETRSFSEFYIKINDNVDSGDNSNWIKILDHDQIIGKLYSSFNSAFFFMSGANGDIEPYGPYLISTSNDNSLRYLKPNTITGANDGRWRIIPQILKDIPLTSSSDGNKGEIAIDDDYFYACVSNNSWKRIGLSSW